MRLNTLNRNHRISLRLMDSKSTIDNFGTFPENETLGELVDSGVLREIVKAVSRETEKEVFERLETIESPKESLNLGIEILSELMDSFGLKEFFDKLQKNTKRDYKLYDYFKLIVGRNIIDPESLLNYYEEQDYYSKFISTGKFKKQDFYDFLTFFYEHRLEFQKFLFETTVKTLGKQKIHIYFYDGTNFYFFKSVADPDHFDRIDREVKRGLRQFGYSKESRNNKVLVSLGIIASELGIPLFFTVFPGNEQEISHIKTDLNNLRNSLLRMGEQGISVLAADAGLYSGDLIYRITGENKKVYDLNYRTNDGYIIGRGIGQVGDKTRKWALELKDYHPIPSDDNQDESKKTYIKSRVVFLKIPVRLKDGRIIMKETRQKQIALYSKKTEARKRKTIEKNIEKALKLIEKPKELKKFIQKNFEFSDLFGLNKETGEVFANIISTLKDDKIQNELERAGMFIITTSEVEMNDFQVLRYYRDKNTIEQLIRCLKSVIKARPIFVYTYEHIVSHLDLDVISGIFLNYLKLKVNKSSSKTFSAKKIQRALYNFNAFNILDDKFIITGNNGLIKKILETFGISPFFLFSTREEIELKFKAFDNNLVSL